MNIFQRAEELFWSLIYRRAFRKIRKKHFENNRRRHSSRRVTVQAMLDRDLFADKRDRWLACASVQDYIEYASKYFDICFGIQFELIKITAWKTDAEAIINAEAAIEKLCKYVKNAGPKDIDLVIAFTDKGIFHVRNKSPAAGVAEMNGRCAIVRLGQDAKHKTTIHEIGHLFGAFDTEMESIMNSVNTTRQFDAKNFGLVLKNRLRKF